MGLVVLGLALRRPLGRQNVATRLRLAVAALPWLAERPARTVVLIAATAEATGCYVVALAVVLRGFSVDLPFVAVALAYLASSSRFLPSAAASSSSTSAFVGSVTFAFLGLPGLASSAGLSERHPHFTAA